MSTLLMVGVIVAYLVWLAILARHAGTQLSRVFRVLAGTIVGTMLSIALGLFPQQITSAILSSAIVSAIVVFGSPLLRRS